MYRTVCTAKGLCRVRGTQTCSTANTCWRATQQQQQPHDGAYLQLCLCRARCIVLVLLLWVISGH